MKLNTLKEFTPFVISFTIDNPQEARLLYHVFNRCDLRDAIFEGNYGHDKTKEDVASEFDDDCVVSAFIATKVSI